MSSKPFIVAEISANHLGGIARAKELIRAAAGAGADAVKLQTYDPAEMVAGPYTLQEGPWAGYDLGNLYREAMTPREWHAELFGYAAEQGIECFSTPFSASDVDFLETLGCPRYKIASFELVDLPLIEYAASKGKPLILSTGMADRLEIGLAVVTAINAPGAVTPVTVLKCTSAYPASAADANLATLADMRDFGEFGVSDHTLGIAVPVAATALGASMIEKHFTIKRSDGGPDAAFSLEPREFAEMVKACRDAACSIGDVTYGPSTSERAQYCLRRSLYFAQDIPRGRMVRMGAVRTARPALGIAPKFIDQVIGANVTRDVKAGEPVTWDVLQAS